MLTGTINPIVPIRGVINGGHISAKLNQVITIKGAINDRQSIHGAISSNGMLSGSVKKSDNMSAVVGIYEGMNPEKYDGEYNFTSTVEGDTVVDTKFKFLRDNITVGKIPYYETSNPTGTTVYIGE